MNYLDYLKHPKWQKKRLEVMKIDNFKCCICDSSVDTLHVHHIRYIENLKPWEYSNSLLVTLCADCHDFVHERGRWSWITAYERYKRIRVNFDECKEVYNG
jgi:5-methylcytosine-specific restriction endonuclease McrA